MVRLLELLLNTELTKKFLNQVPFLVHLEVLYSTNEGLVENFFCKHEILERL